MISDEEFATLKKRVEDLESLVHGLALSHKDVLEKYLPEAVNGLNGLITGVAASNSELTNKVTDLMNAWSQFVDVTEKRFDDLEFRVDNPIG